MKLSKKAIKDLKNVLIKEVSLETANSFTDEELNKIGLLFLTILKESLRMEIEEEKTFVK